MGQDCVVMQTINLLITVASMCTIFLFDVSTATIKFYGGTNKSPFDTFYVDSRDHDCKQISEVRMVDQFPTKFVITESCLIVYENRDCDNSDWSLKVSPPGINFDREVNSFQNCKGDADISQLDVYIVSYNDKSSDTQEVIESYRHLCECQNVPKYIQELENWSINNYGNRLMAYFDTDCLDKEWDSMLLEQGDHMIAKQSTEGHDFEKANIDMIRSFGPDPNSTYFKTRCLSFQTFTEVYDKRQEIAETLKTLETQLESLIQLTESELKENNTVVDKMCMMKQMFYPFVLADDS